MEIHPADIEQVNQRAHALALELVNGDGPPTVTKDQIEEALEAGYTFIRADHPGLTRHGTRIIVFPWDDLRRMCVLTTLIEVAPGGPGHAVAEAARALAEANGTSTAMEEHFDNVTRDALMEHDLMPIPSLLLTFTVTNDPDDAARLP